jgi:hypothetical protein
MNDVLSLRHYIKELGKGIVNVADASGRLGCASSPQCRSRFFLFASHLSLFSGMYPIHWAAFQGHEEIALILVEVGADVNVLNCGAYGQIRRTSFPLP